MEFICPRCDVSFKRKDYLLAHLKKQNECPTTSSTETRQSLIDKLTAKIYNEHTYDCDFCNKKFNDPSNRIRHKKTCKRNPINMSQTDTVITQEDTEEDVQQDDLLNTEHKTDETRRLEDIITRQNDKILGLRNELQKTQQIVQRQKVELAFLKRKKNEDFYQGIMEQHFNATHKTLDSGITDITTDDAHYEIKRWNCWKEALSQLILYNDDDPKENMYACFFETCSEQQKKKVQSKFEKYNITCLEFREEKNKITLCNLESGEIKLTYTFPEII